MSSHAKRPLYDSGLLRPLRSLGRSYRELEESSMWARLLLGNLWPAYLFCLPLIGKVWNMARFVREGPGPEGLLHFQAQLARDLVVTAFFLLVVALFAIRAPVLGPRANLRGALVALAGTFLLNLVEFLPVPAAKPPTAALLASTGIVVVGTLFTIWSLATLGRCFGIFPEARGLVTQGPYRWVRHPVYLGELISGLGILLTRPHPLVVLTYVLFVGLQYWRTLFEDEALARAFPSEYPRFKARSGRLLPRWG